MNLIDLHRLMVMQTGVLMTTVQKWLYYGKDLDKNKIVGAISVILGCVAQIAIYQNSDLHAVREKNIAKLKCRFPEKFTTDLAAEENRDRAAERKVLEQQEPMVSAKGSCMNCGETIGIIATPPFTVGGVLLEQTGAGFAEPPEEASEAQVADWAGRPYTTRELQREDSPMFHQGIKPSKAQEAANNDYLLELRNQVSAIFVMGMADESRGLNMDSSVQKFCDWCHTKKPEYTSVALSLKRYVEDRDLGLSVFVRNLLPTMGKE